MKSWWNRNVRDAKAQGAKDGARMIPATEGTVVSQWEERLVNDYEASIRHFEGRFKQAVRHSGSNLNLLAANTPR